MGGNLKKISLIVMLLSVAGCFGAYIVLTPEEQKSLEKVAEYPINKQIKYSFTLQNKSKENLVNQTFWVYAPVKQTASQKVINIKSSHVFELIEDKFKNQILVFYFKELPPYSNKIVSIQVSLNMAEIPNNSALEWSDEFLKSSPNLDLHDPDIIKISQQLKQAEPEQSALNAYHWSINNIRNTGYRAEQLSASEVIQKRAGDCTEFMHVVTAINRSNQIATREVAGFIVRQSRILKANEYHNWAEIYLDGRWTLTDPQNKKHQKNHQDYIAFRHYGFDPTNPIQDMHRYKASDDRIRAVMN